MANKTLPFGMPHVTPARRAGRMLPAHHITHRTLLRCGNVMAGLAVCVACLIGSPASAADIDAATAKQAFAVAANWVARGQAPRETFALPAVGVSAVHVTLRHQGLTLGQATATAPTPLRPADLTDVLDLMKRAVVKALTESQKALTALASRADRRTVPSTLAAIAPELQFDVQFAGVPQAVRLERFIDLPKAFVLDHHGLVLERQGKLAWAFPATSLAANVSLAGQIDRLMGQLDIPLLDRPTIGSPKGPALYRFDALHMVSRGRGKPATVLHRGNVLLPAKPFDAEASATHATQWADHLLRVQREDGHFAGTFEPTAGRFASPHRHARRCRSGGLRPGAVVPRAWTADRPSRATCRRRSRSTGGHHHRPARFAVHHRRRGQRGRPTPQCRRRRPAGSHGGRLCYGGDRAGRDAGRQRPQGPAGSPRRGAAGHAEAGWGVSSRGDGR
jgi:hypothetical protein